jgi:enoyl-CoA hydratase
LRGTRDTRQWQSVVLRARIRFVPPIAVETYDHVRLRRTGPILRATITNPAKKNAVNAGVAGDLDRLWRDVDADDEIRVVVLAGEGEAFCSGLDLSRIANGDTPGTARRSKAAAKGIRDRIWDILDCETPTIAKVRGPAYGMGVNIALACDFVIAADDARFCDNHIKNGITAGDGGVPLFPLLVGFRRAKEMLMLGEPISGKEAAEIGLINQSVPAEQLDAATGALAQRLADGPPLALAWTKVSLNVLLKQLSLGAFETSIAYDLLSLRTDDVREGNQAFFEKRSPRFTGT